MGESGFQAERLTEGLSEIDILSWQDSYGGEKDRCIDGFCWEIQLFMGELPVRRMKGINRKPEHFDELILMVEQTVSRDFGTKRPEFL